MDYLENLDDEFLRIMRLLRTPEISLKIESLKKNQELKLRLKLCEIPKLTDPSSPNVLFMLLLYILLDEKYIQNKSFVSIYNMVFGGK